MAELPKTEAELDAYVQKALDEKIAKVKADYDKQAHDLRKKFDSDLESEKRKLQLSADERARVEAEESNKKLTEELNALRYEKKMNDLERRLTKEGIPTFLKNDSRLINATEENFESTLKVVKKEWQETQPKGNTHSSVVQINTGGSGAQLGTKEQVFAETGNALAELVGKN